MEQLDSVTGFSELKDLLIRTHKIEKDRELVKLYFSEFENELLMHDYNDHKKVIHLCYNLINKIPNKSLPFFAKRLIIDSLKHKKPSEFLNNGFKLYGFFRT